MDKAAFLDCLARQLVGLPQEEIKKHQDYYSELLADMLEDGMEETQAVAKLGDPIAMGNQIRRDMGYPNYQTQAPQAPKPQKKDRGWSTAALVIAIVGAPLWVSLAIAAVSLVGSLYLTLWSLILAAGAVVLSLLITGVAAAVYGLTGLFLSPLRGMLSLGAGLVLLALGLVGIPLLWLAVKALIRGTRWMFEKIRSWLQKRKEA